MGINQTPGTNQPGAYQGLSAGLTNPSKNDALRSKSRPLKILLNGKLPLEIAEGN